MVARERNTHGLDGQVCFAVGAAGALHGQAGLKSPSKWTDQYGDSESLERPRLNYLGFWLQ